MITQTTETIVELLQQKKEIAKKLEQLSNVNNIREKIDGVADLISEDSELEGEIVDWLIDFIPVQLLKEAFIQKADIEFDPWLGVEGHQ